MYISGLDQRPEAVLSLVERLSSKRAERDT
jgi:hypothetical protein